MKGAARLPTIGCGCQPGREHASASSAPHASGTAQTSTNERPRIVPARPPTPGDAHGEATTPRRHKEVVRMRTLRILSAMLVAGLLLTTVAALPAAAGTRVTAGLPPIRPRSAFTLTVTNGEK